MTLYYGDEEEVVFPQLARILLPAVSTSDLLELLVELAVSAVAGVSGASVSAVRNGGNRFETVNASSEAIRDMDQLQYRSRRGPCVEAIRSSSPISSGLPTDRWPEFSRQAVAEGVGSVTSLPIIVGEEALGALNLYSESPAGLEPEAARVANGLVKQSAVVMANAFALTLAEMTAAQLREALETRDLIGQAKGVIMGRQGVGADEAFDILRRASQRTNRRLRDVAADLIRHYTVPGIKEP